MTQVQVLQNCKGTQDGFVVEQFTKGDVVDIREGLARQFFKEGKAEKTLDQVHKEWIEIVTQTNAVMRDDDIGFVERNLKDKGDTLGLKHFRGLQFIYDMQRETLKALEGV